MMGKWLGIAVMAVVVAGGVLWGFGATKPVLHIYSFSGYFDPELVKEFEEANECIVHIDYFESNEEADVKVREGGALYDLLTMSSYFVSIWRGLDMLAPMDDAGIPNKANIDPGFLRFTADPKMQYSVPYTRTVTGIGYNTRMFPNPPKSWAALAEPTIAGRVTMLDDAREALGAALKYLGVVHGDVEGYSLNTTDEAKINEAADQLLKWKGGLARFEIDAARTGLADGTYALTQQYNGDVAVIMSEEGSTIDFFVPEEGSSLASDDFVILKGARQAALARKFVNFLLEPENAARNMNEIMYYMPVPKAFPHVDPALLENRAFTISDELLEKCEVIENVGEHMAKYVAAWDRVKGGAGADD